MAAQPRCPKCGSTDLRITDRWHHLKWFVMGILLSIVCVFLIVHNVKPVLSAIGMFISTVIALVYMVNFLFHQRNKAACRNCGNRFYYLTN